MRNSSEDSENDEDELRQVIDKSYKKLLVMESHFSRANNLHLTKDTVFINFKLYNNFYYSSKKKVTTFKKILIFF